MAGRTWLLIVTVLSFICGIGALCPPPPRVYSASVDRINATLANYTCSSGRILSGSNFIQCIHSVWTARPTCVRVQCTPPPIRPNSNIDRVYSWSTYYIGRRIHYNCNYGYQNVRNISDVSIMCQLNLTWTPLNLECTEKDCGSAPELENGRTIAVSKVTFRGKATYECHDGFKLEPPGGRRYNRRYNSYDVSCGNSGWGRMPRCIPVKCGSSTDVEHASKFISGENIYTDVVVYQCAEKYELVGNNTATCGKNGKWSPAPSCHKLTCSPPTDVANASIIELNGQYFGESIRYECVKGYQTKQSSSIVCLRNGNWTSYPICEPIDCGIPPSIHFGSTKYHTTTYGSNATYKCETSFKIIGINYIRCRENGQWEEAPLCESTDGIIDFLNPATGSLTDTTNESQSDTTSESLSDLSQIMIILSVAFILLSILLIILIIALIKVYGYCGNGSTPCCIPGSGILTKPGSPAARDHMGKSFASEDQL